MRSHHLVLGVVTFGLLVGFSSSCRAQNVINNPVVGDLYRYYDWIPVDGTATIAVYYVELHYQYYDQTVYHDIITPIQIWPTWDPTAGVAYWNYTSLQAFP